MAYLLALAAVHFAASSALGAMGVLSAKALCDMRRARNGGDGEAASE